MSRSTPFGDSVPEVCPICGHPVDDVGLQGLNADICLSCYRNLHVHTPLTVHVIGETAPFQVWLYPAITDAWPRSTFPTFLDRSFDAGKQRSDIDAGIEFADLSSLEQTIVEELRQEGQVDGVDTLETIAYDSVWKRKAESVDPFSQDPPGIDKSTDEKLINQLPRPIVFDGSYIHTVDVQRVQGVLSEPKSRSTEQTSLF